MGTPRGLGRATATTSAAIETYNSGELLRLLELGYPIEACCTECDVHWPIGPEVRVQIAQAIAANLSVH